MSAITDFVIDYETLGNAPEGAVVDLAVLVFEHDPENVPTFKDLVKRGKRFKFDLASQKGIRAFDQNTIDWWKKQSEEARINLKPSDIDINYLTFYDEFMKFLTDQGFNKKTGLGWCRGQSFDFGILVDMLRQIFKTRDTFYYEPCFFWNQRDVRTAVEATLLTRGLTMCPMPKGSLDGFVAHDAVHDCAKAALELLYSKRYAMGLQECPVGDDIDPLSVRK